MRFSLAVAALSAAVSVWAQTDHQVMVGQGGLTFTPNQITVANGDSVTFSFMAKNHSVTQSTFANPCVRQTTPALGVDSGFQPIPAAGLNGAAPPQWKITITNASAPLWFFCAQTVPANHCQTGMVFAINPTAAKSFDAFQAAAKAGAAGGAGAPPVASSPTGAAPTLATGAPTAGAPTAGIPTVTGAAGPLPTSAGIIPTGNVPTAATGIPVSSADPAAVSGAAGANPTNAAGKLTSGLTGLFTVAVVAMLL